MSAESLLSFLYMTYDRNSRPEIKKNTLTPVNSGSQRSMRLREKQFDWIN